MAYCIVFLPLLTSNTLKLRRDWVPTHYVMTYILPRVSKENPILCLGVLDDPRRPVDCIISLPRVVVVRIGMDARLVEAKAVGVPERVSMRESAEQVYPDT